MYPVKVYDKHGNLIKEYNKDELNKMSDEMLKGNTHRKKQNHWRTAKVQREMKQKEASKTNSMLFAFKDTLKKGIDLCKPAPSDLKSDKAPPSGKSKDTTGESGKE